MIGYILKVDEEQTTTIVMNGGKKGLSILEENYDDESLSWKHYLMIMY